MLRREPEGRRKVPDVAVRADDCRIRYDGRPPTGEELQGLFSSLFRSDREGSGLPLRELAIGLNSALALSPSWILVESWDGVKGWALRLADRAEEVSDLESCPWPEQPLPGVRVHLRERSG